MSEYTIMQGLQTAIRASATFADADVTLNDWSILDAAGAMAAGPFAVVTPSDEFTAAWAPSRSVTAWNPQVWLFEAWDTDWPTTMQAFAQTRQAVVDALGDALVPASETQITEIRAAGPPVEADRGDYTYMLQILTIEVQEL